MDDKTRTEVNLKASICTDTPTGTDIWSFGDPDAQHIENTGIERNGGVTNLYEQQTTFTTAGLHSVYAKSGDLVQVDSSHNVRINDTVIGNVGTYGVIQRGALPGYADCAWTADDTIIGIVKVGSQIRVDEIDPANGTILNTRSTTFTMPVIPFTDVAIIKYASMAFSDTLQFMVGNSKVSYSLTEGVASTYPIVGSFNLTAQTLNAGAWQGIAWSPRLNLFAAVANSGTFSAASSPDGINWSTQTLATAAWTAVCWSPELSIFSAVNSDTAVSAVSSDGVNWTTNALTSNQWRSVTWSGDLGLFVAVGNGPTKYSATSTNGTSWSLGSLAAADWAEVCWASGLSKFVAVGVNAVSRSSNGIDWTVGTIAAGQWNAVCWSPQLSRFVAVGSSIAASSSDGILWTSRTIEAQNWRGVTWSPILSMFVAVGSSTKFAISPDGINWTSLVGPDGDWSYVAWSTELLLFAGVSTTTNYAFSATNTLNNLSFAWKFATSSYLVGGQGIASTWNVGDIAATLAAVGDATWCVIDRFAGTAYTRAILTFPVKKNASNLLTGIGEIGYNQAGTLTTTATYYGVALGGVTVSVGTHIEAPGYVEASFTRSDTGTKIWYYQAPIMSHQSGLWYDYQQSQTQTQINGYGRLTDFVGNTLGNTCSLRIQMIAGTPAFLSAGILGQISTAPMDCLGVPLTLDGEFDPFFVPHVVDNGSSKLQCVYRYKGTLYHFTIESGATNTLSKISDNLYLVNSLSPANIIDVRRKTLALGINDYNGRILWRSAAALIPVTKAVGIIQGDYSNSLDSGDKLITQTFSALTNIVPGIELPTFVDRRIQNYGVNVYLADVYSTTYQNFNVTFTNPDLQNVVYSSDPRQPLAMGYTFDPFVMTTETETIFLGVSTIGQPDIDRDYAGYELGNQTAGQFQAFRLYGQTYLFDGNNIYIANFNGSAFSGKEAPLCPATGCQLIAASPTVVYFLSAFDNSIYLFDGGRSLTKFKRMNSLEAFTDGIFSVRDNTLLLQGATTFVWVRDGVVSLNAKKANQTSVVLYDTQDGIKIANNSVAWRYAFESLSGSTVVALDLETAYFGAKNNVKSIVTSWAIYLYSATKAALTLNYTIYTMDTDREAFGAITATQAVIPSMYDQNGVALVRTQPSIPRSVAISLRIQCSSKVTVTKIVPAFTLDTAAIPAADRSR